MIRWCVVGALLGLGLESTAFAAPPTAPTNSSQPAPPSGTAPAPADGTPAPAPAAAPTAAQPTPPGYPPPQYPPGAYPPGAYPPPYPYPPYPPYGAPPPPRTLPYESGQPVPAGYHVESGARRGPVIAGSIVLGVPYALGVSIASGDNFSNSSGWLVIPGLGPWLTLAMRKNCDTSTTTYCDDPATRSILVLDALMQTAGVALLVVGIAVPKTELVRNDVGQIQLIPVAGRDGLGMAAVGRF